MLVHSRAFSVGLLGELDEWRTRKPPPPVRKQTFEQLVEQLLALFGRVNCSPLVDGAARRPRARSLARL